MIEKINYADYGLAKILSDLEFEIFGTNWQPEIILQKIIQNEFIYWIHTTNSKINAYVAVQVIDDELHIIGIGVKEEFRNKNIARELMDTLLQFFLNKDYVCIRLEVRETNIAAINLYKSYLFQEYGVRENYYKNESAVLFELRKLNAIR